jgi:hypothetical protein
MLQRVAAGDTSAVLTAPIIMRVVHGILAGCDDDEKLRRSESLTTFFASEHFAACPFQWISARMFAVLRHQVRQENAYTNRQKAEKKLLGFTHDVRHIATCAPYCDAIFVDKAIAHILRDSRIALEIRYGTRVLSRSNHLEFEQWLLSVENSMDNFHRAALKIIHPERDDHQSSRH